jgi:hypothetical protein
MSRSETGRSETHGTRLLDPASGIYRDMRISREGVDTVLRLRSTYGVPRKPLSDPDRYFDESYLFHALKR